MAFLDKINDIAKNIGDKTEDLAKNISDKTSDALESGKLSLKINSERNAIIELEKQLGAFYYEKYAAGKITPEPEALALFQNIEQRRKTIDEAQAEILRNRTAAGSAVPPGSRAEAGPGQAQGGGASAASPEQPSAEAEPRPSAAQNTPGVLMCAACGASNSMGSSFCGTCGSRMQ